MKPVQALVIAGAVLIAVGEAVGQRPDTLGLTQAVNAALENNPVARAARLQIDQAGNRSAEARAERAPQIQISETLTRSNNPVFVFGSLLEQGRFGPENFALPALNNPDPLTNFRTVLAAKLPVFDGKKTSARIAQSDIGNDQAFLHKQTVEQRIRFEVLEDYFGVLVCEATVGVFDGAVKLAESDIQRARDRLDAGLAVESDVLAAQVQLSEFRQQRIQAVGNVATAFTVLNVAMGSPSDERRTLVSQLLEKTFNVARPDELVRRALLHRPDYQHATSGIDLADQRISERRSEYLPAVSVFASIGSSGHTLTTGSSDYAFGAAATFELFDRGRPARLSQALTDKRLAQTESNRVADQIRIEVTRAYNQYRAAEEQLKVAEAALSQATEGLRIIQDRYEAGLTTITDVLRAETALVRTRLNVVVSRHDHYLGYANVLLSAGELDDVTEFEH